MRIACGDDVSARVGSARRALEARCRRGGERVVFAPELLPVTGRLLEVVADDLVLLDEGGMRVKPGGEPLVQVGAGRTSEGCRKRRRG